MKLGMATRVVDDLGSIGETVESVSLSSKPTMSIYDNTFGRKSKVETPAYKGTPVVSVKVSPNSSLQPSPTVIKRAIIDSAASKMSSEHSVGMARMPMLDLKETKQASFGKGLDGAPIPKSKECICAAHLLVNLGTGK